MSISIIIIIRKLIISGGTSKVDLPTVFCGSVGWGLVQVAQRSTAWLDLLVLGPVFGFVGGSRLFWMTSRRVESWREHSGVSDLKLIIFGRLGG